jgi:hypothetical protein
MPLAARTMLGTAVVAAAKFVLATLAADTVSTFHRAG